MMKVVRDTVILRLSELLLFYFLLEYAHTPAGLGLGFMMLILSILGRTNISFCTNNGIAEINFNNEKYSRYIKFKEVFFKITSDARKNNSFTVLKNFLPCNLSLAAGISYNGSGKTGTQNWRSIAFQL
jgi:hypothetical protein